MGKSDGVAPEKLVDVATDIGTVEMALVLLSESLVSGKPSEKQVRQALGAVILVLEQAVNQRFGECVAAYARQWSVSSVALESRLDAMIKRAASKKSDSEPWLRMNTKVEKVAADLARLGGVVDGVRTMVGSRATGKSLGDVRSEVAEFRVALGEQRAELSLLRADVKAVTPTAWAALARANRPWFGARFATWLKGVFSHD